MPNYRYLSFPLGLDDPRPPAIPAPKLVDLYTIANDGANVQTLTLASHTGTHLDAPLHVVDGGLTIHDFTPEELIYTSPVIIELRMADCQVVSPDDLEPYKAALSNCDLALFRFDVGMIRKSEPERFSLKSPGFGIPAARYLRDNFPNMRAMGMDVPSLACIATLEETMAAHNELLGGPNRRFIAIEDMNLDQDLTGLTEVRVNPWLVSGMDSGPCSVIGVF